MFFLSSIFNAVEENCINTTRQLLSALKIKVSRTGIKTIANHPDYPSMLSISDSLTKWQIESIAIKVTVEKIPELPTPFIVKIETKKEGEFLVVVDMYDGEKFVVSEPVSKGWKTIPKEELLQQATGIVLLAEVQQNSGEKEYKINKRRENFRTFVNAATIAIVLLLCTVGVFCSFYRYNVAGWAASALLMLKLFGCCISILLLWYEIDSHNPTLQKVCSGSKNVNCGAVLKSEAAKIFGLSWSEIGFFYFFGGLATLLAGMLSPEFLLFIAWFNIIVLPYTVFSIYYQWRIAEQWCVLCLIVQGILVSEFLVAFSGGLHTIAPLSVFTWTFVAAATLCYALPALSWFLLKPLLQAYKENARNKIALRKLRYRPEIFEALLKKQKAIQHPTNGLGIVIGNPDAATKIIKVCNPYCRPCANAHGVLDEMIEDNENIQLQIIFTVTNRDNDIRGKAARHLMAIAEKNDTALTVKALNDWYLAGKKDYAVFAEKYPMNGEIEAQREKINSMSEWCDKTEITFTPTIFVDGYQLPHNYDVTDLKYFLAK